MGPPKSGTPAYAAYLEKQKLRRRQARQDKADKKAAANPIVKRRVKFLEHELDTVTRRSNVHMKANNKHTKEVRQLKKKQ